jgi:polysaccharide biosynthesis/export protein
LSPFQDEETMRKKPFSHTGYLLIFVVISCLLICACGKPQLERENFDVVIEQDQDMANIDKIETLLTVTPEKAMLHPDFQLIENIAVPYVPHYRMGPGDVVELIYHIDYSIIEDNYFLEMQDKINIHFPYHPQFSSTVLIRPDGRVTIPIIGDVYAESTTPKELAEKLSKEYSRYFNNPNITVSLEEFNVKIVELKKAITNAQRGQSKIAPITPDGRISFPIIGTMQAEGLTVPELEEMVNEKYKNIVKNLHTTVILEEIHHSKFYIIGAVENPGRYDMRFRFNLLDALVEAGGFPPTANLEEIIIFRNYGLERPIAMKVNLAAMFQQNQLQNLILRPADIVYVPKTKLGDFNDLVEQIFTRGIYAVVPFTTSAGVSATYSLGGREPR